MFEEARLVLHGDGIQRPQELADLIDATAGAYERELPDLASIIIFGGITLGEFHPRCSDVDLAVVFDQRAPKPSNHLPESVERAIAGLAMFEETFVRPKHVTRATLEMMQALDWRAWADAASSSDPADADYPLTFCDTWMVHRRGLVASGTDLISEFPFENAPPTTPAIERRALERLSDRLARPAPFGGLTGDELVREIIYYGTAMTRAIYTIRTGAVIGRVASTRWYAGTFGGEVGATARLLGELRCRSALDDVPDQCRSTLSLRPLLEHYRREVAAFTG